MFVNNIFQDSGGLVDDVDDVERFDNRSIPEPMKRAIRQRCGFGCVVCGVIIYDYDHMLKDWADVRKHEESDITLLCPQHHREKTSGLMTKEQVMRADRDPWNLKNGQTNPYLLNFEGAAGVVIVANNCFTNEILGSERKYWSLMVPVLIDGFPVIGFCIEDGRLLLDVTLHNECNEQILLIRRNQLIWKPDNWDVYFKGSSLSLREAKGKILLEIEFCPPSKIIVNRAKVRMNGVTLELLKDHFVVNGEKSRIFTKNLISSPVGISIGDSSIYPRGVVHLQAINRYS